MAGGTIIAASSAALVATLTPVSEIQLTTRDVRVTDVAQLRGPAAEAVGAIVIARLPEGRSEKLSRDRLEQLLRRAVPMISIEGERAGDISLIPPAIAAPSQMPAMDEHSVEPAVRRGDKLTLVSREGPVTITRQVTAVQTIRRNQRRLFVQTEDGTVFSAPIAEGEAQ